MKKLVFVLMIFISGFSFAQDVELIKPIVESPIIASEQMKSFVNMQFKNWGIEKLKLNEVMKSKTGKGVKICICDTGESIHKDHRKQVVESKNFITGEDVIDGNGHSTHVSGIINEIAPDAELYFAKVLSNRGRGNMLGVAGGIDWCVSKGVHIINMSLGSKQPNAAIEKSLNIARDKKVLVIAAAGNEGQSKTENTMGYPSKYEQVIAVGSINDKIVVSDFSSSGKEGDVVAPGQSILSTWLNDDYIVLSGTSMATPYVAGMAALRMEDNLDDYDLEVIYEKSANDILQEGFDVISFWGYVNNDFFENRDTSVVDPPNGEEPSGDESILNFRLILFGVAIVVVIFLLYRYHKTKY